jgi:hypothetical protein
LDELIIAGELQESSKKSVLKIVSCPTGLHVDAADKQVAQSDAIEEGMFSLFNRLPIPGLGRMSFSQGIEVQAWMCCQSSNVKLIHSRDCRRLAREVG